MKEYAIKFEGRSNGININQLNNTLLLPMFSNYNGQIIDMYRLVATLYNNGWEVTQITNNVNNTVYKILSKQINASLILTISKEFDYQKKNEQNYVPTINILRDMSKNAVVSNNNVTNIMDFQNNQATTTNNNYSDTPNLKVIQGTMYQPNIKKFLKTKKGKIALCTAIGLAIVAGSFIVYTAVSAIETQKFLDEHKNSTHQTTTMPSCDYQRGFDEALQNNQVDTTLASQHQELEQQKQMQMEEMNQRIR